MSDLSTLERSAYRIRRYALRMGEVQGQGYIGQALGWADVLATAYCHAMTYRPAEPEWEGRDRFLLSHGHYAIAHYAALIEAGILPETELETYGSSCPSSFKNPVTSGTTLVIITQTTRTTTPPRIFGYRVAFFTLLDIASVHFRCLITCVKELVMLPVSSPELMSEMKIGSKTDGCLESATEKDEPDDTSP